MEAGIGVWYRVRDLQRGRAFYTRTLGFTETYADPDGIWFRLQRGDTKIELAEGDPGEGGVAIVAVDDAKGEADRLRAAGVEVGTVLELHGQVRLVDVFDPEGNRIQLAEDLQA